MWFLLPDVGSIASQLFRSFSTSVVAFPQLILNLILLSCDLANGTLFKPSESKHVQLLLTTIFSFAGMIWTWLFLSV